MTTILTVLTGMDLGFIRFSNFPAEIQGMVWQCAAWEAKKPQQAQLSLISKTAMLWRVDFSLMFSPLLLKASIRIQDVLYHSIHAENALFTNLAKILQDDTPPAALFRRKTRSLWLVSMHHPHQVLFVLHHLRNITRLFIDTGSSHVGETLRSVLTMPRLREARFPPHYFYLVPFSQLESTLVSSAITHLFVPTDITTEVPDMYLWTSFPKLTHLVVLITSIPDDDNFEALCNRSPENLVVVDRGPPHLPRFAPKRRFSRKPIIVRTTLQREWVSKKLWAITGKFWDTVDRSVREAKAGRDDKYFIEIKEW
ncbi:hypothetical protein DL96DRAFT_1681832 [Flagelloscypha sp. PMI_526]|nr:hypothetical protein DL96DRAFT_1681832 [Flagelloscypha sp. PMI_526]